MGPNGGGFAQPAPAPVGDGSNPTPPLLPPPPALPPPILLDDHALFIALVGVLVAAAPPPLALAHRSEAPAAVGIVVAVSGATRWVPYPLRSSASVSQAFAPHEHNHVQLCNVYFPARIRAATCNGGCAIGIRGAGLLKRNTERRSILLAYMHA